MTSRFMLIFAAISGFIFVALGAFGAVSYTHLTLPTTPYV